MGEGGSAKYLYLITGGVGSQNLAKSCPRNLWIALNEISATNELGFYEGYFVFYNQKSMKCTFAAENLL